MSREAEFGPIPDTALINTRQQVDALAGTMRMRILKAAAEPRSIKEIAEALGVPPTRLYYHVNMLEEVGFVDVVETRKSGARIEKIYRVAAKSFRAGPDLAGNVGNVDEAAAALTGLVMDVTRVEAEAALAHRLDGGTLTADMGRVQGNLTESQAEEIAERVEAILREVIDTETDDPSARAYSFTYLLLPTEVDDS